MKTLAFFAVGIVMLFALYMGPGEFLTGAGQIVRSGLDFLLSVAGGIDTAAR